MPKTKKAITARDILRLLHERHHVDKFLSVDECKIGSTWFKANCSRFDLWVMARSWASPRFIGYEIKVDRQDFMRDTKWQAYLNYCTEFYFVAPPGIIDATEVPELAGLIVSSKNCKRLYTKKKAPVRNVEIPNSILIYILMSRSRIVGDMFQTRPRGAVWEDRLKAIEKNKQIGHSLAYCIRNRVNKEVKEIKRENEKLRQENEKIMAIKTALNQMGIDINKAIPGYSNFVRKDRLKELITGIPYNLVEYLKEAETNLIHINNLLEKAMKIDGEKTNAKNLSHDNQ